jgi:hypothetical protein
LFFDPGNQHRHERQNSDKSPGPTLAINRSSKSCANSAKHCALGHALKKVALAIFDTDVLQLFDFVATSLSIGTAP